MKDEVFLYFVSGGGAADGVDRRSAAKGVTVPAPGQPSPDADGRGASPSDLWRPSVRLKGPAGEVIPAT